MNSAFKTAVSQERSIERIPAELLALAQWIAWWSVAGQGQPVKLPNGRFTDILKEQAKPHKLPINPSTGGLAATTRPRTWSSAEKARGAAQRWSITGIGFVFTDSDPYSGVDIDNCRNPETGQIADWAWTIIRTFDSYSEISPSGTGVHIIVRGKLPSGKGNQAKRQDGKVEMFSRARYFTVTGLHVDSTPTEILDRQRELIALHNQLFGSRNAPKAERPAELPAPTLLGDRELIEKARTAANGPKFDRLWCGQWKGDYASQSEADIALCCLLAFWTQNDAARIDSLFRQSALMRNKWDREDYRQRTIGAAITQTPDTYKPRRRFASKSRRVSAMAEAGDPTAAGQDIPILLWFPYTDVGNAERLVKLYGSETRFCAEMRKWLVWDGRRWVINDSGNVKQLFKKTIRKMYEQAADIGDEEKRKAAEKHARQSEAAMRIRAALECAEHEEGIRISASSLDRHPYLLNCKNGTIDLQTGELRRHERQDLVTKLVHFSYRADTTCPQFMRFLYRIMGDNAEGEPSDRAERLVRYLQKCFGYSLTADVSEKVVFCFFGSGNNGKTTLLEIIRFILAEYSAQVLIDSLMAHKTRESNTSTADLADLRGARFVTTSEAEEGQRLALGKLKYLSQGMGEIKACRKYENPISFTATHKLFLDANHKPVIRGAENAVWNRLKPIPFVITIPPEEIDKKLLERLKSEAEGILAWMVEGCLRWMREGLGDPPEVVEASAAWRAESDRFPAFLEEHYVLQPNAWVPVAEPWQKYLVWGDSNRERDRLSKTAFDTKLQDLGCRKGVREGGKVRVWIGIRPRSSEDFTQPTSDKVTAGDSKS